MDAALHPAHHPSHSSSSLPLAAWQVIVEHLQPEDALAARLVCSCWRQDLGSFVTTAKAVPSDLLLLVGQQQQPQQPQQPPATACGPSAAATTQAVARLLEAFPHCNSLDVDVSSAEEQGLAATLLNRLTTCSSSSNAVAGSSSSSSKCAGDAATASSDKTCGGSRDEAAECVVGMDDLCAGMAQDTTASADGVCSVQQQGVGPPSGCKQTSATAAAAEGQRVVPHHSGSLCRGGQRLCPRVCLDAVPRSFHCKARQDYPRQPAGTSAALFSLLLRLPQQLHPAALSLLHTLTLDTFPDNSPQQWLLLKGLPCLRELLLPPFKPSLPHEHLPAVAQLTQLTALELSVQGSVTSWRSCCESFSSVGALTRLQKLSMHAFHCPGRSLAAGLSALVRLSELRLSGRVVLSPLQQCLRGLSRLRVLELTQDVQCSVLCELQQSLPHLTQLAVGRVTLPPPAHQHVAAAPPAVAAAAAMAAAEMGQWPLPGAAAAAAVPPAAAVQAAPPAAAAVAAVAPAAGVAVAIAAAQQQQDVEADGEGLEVEIEAADAGAEEEEEGGGPQQQQQPAELPAWALPPPPPPPPAVGAGHGGGGGEVMLEDVGLIVDGLVGNLQEGAIPLHLQRIIERFESIIQLDLTRRASSSPWTWPTGGLGLVREAVGPGGFVGVGQDGSGRGCWQQEQREEEWEEEWQWDEQKRGGCDNNSSSRGSGDGSSNGGAGSSSSSALRSFELALLKPSDVARLSELPAEMRGTQHLGLRLRDQLLAFASVCALKLEPGQLAPLGHTFDNLVSLSLCGKVSMDGTLFRELTAALGGGSNGGGCGGSSSKQGARKRVPLQSLCLDLHFVGVGDDDVAAALGAVPQLKALSLRHRGAGKLLVPVSALPPSLTILALKKVMLFGDSSGDGRDGDDGSNSSSGGDASTGGCSTRPCTPEPQQHQRGTQQHLDVAGGVGELADADLSEMSHAITSPGFNRAALTGSISTPDLQQTLLLQQQQGSMAEGVADQPSAGGGAGSSCCCCIGSSAGASQRPPLLPHLRRLYLKLCFVPAAAMDALLGLPTCPRARYQLHSQRQELLAVKRQEHWQRRQQAFESSSSSSGGGVQEPFSRVVFTSSCRPSPFAAAGSSCCSGSSAINAAAAAAPQRQSCLEVLSLTGESSSLGEQTESWERWLQALEHLKALQVLELAVPDHLGCSLPLSLLTTLHSHLPRLAHLHLTTSHSPQQLMQLASLRGSLRTLSVNYTGPPALPVGLLEGLQQGLGPYCRVQLWEQIALQQQGSFGAAAGAAGGGEGGGAGGVGTDGGAEASAAVGQVAVGVGQQQQEEQGSSSSASQQPPADFHSVWVDGGEVGREGPWVVRVGGSLSPDGVTWEWDESQCPPPPAAARKADGGGGVRRLKGWLGGKAKGGGRLGRRVLQPVVVGAGALGVRVAYSVFVFEAGRQLGRFVGSCRHRGS